MKPTKYARSASKLYEIGYRRPPKKFQFRKGRSGNPSGKRTKPGAPDLKALLEGALNKPMVRGKGQQRRIRTKGAAGIEELVDQFANGDRNARRDLFLLSKELGVALTNREVLQDALDEVLSAEDEALLADFVKRYGGHYPIRADTANENPLSPPVGEAKVLTAQPESSADSQTGSTGGAVR
jgi:hypothetical protein